MSEVQNKVVFYLAKYHCSTRQFKGNTITWKQESTLKNHEMTFTLGQEFDETTPDGRSFKATITLEDGKLVQKQKAIKVFFVALQISFTFQFAERRQGISDHEMG